MSNIIKKEKKLTLNSKKGRQIALEQKITEINNRLKELGIEGLKYKIEGAITNPETTQNTVNIQTTGDIPWLFRTLAYFTNIVNIKKEFCKDANLTETAVLTNNQNHQIKNIIDDIKLRLVFLHNQKEITLLTEMKNKLTPFMDEESRFVSTLKEIEALMKH